MFLKQWCNLPSWARYSYLKQRNLTDFLKSMFYLKGYLWFSEIMSFYITENSVDLCSGILRFEFKDKLLYCTNCVTIDEVRTNQSFLTPNQRFWIMFRLARLHMCLIKLQPHIAICTKQCKNTISSTVSYMDLDHL